MIIDKSFEKYLLATLFLRFGSSYARNFEHYLSTRRDAENPLQETLAAYDVSFPQIDNSATLYLFLSSSPFIYSVMKDIYDFSPPNKLTVKSHLTMSLNIIDDMLKKDPNDERIPETLRRGNYLRRLQNNVIDNTYLASREVRSIVN